MLLGTVYLPGTGQLGLQRELTSPDCLALLYFFSSIFYTVIYMAFLKWETGEWGGDGEMLLAAEGHDPFRD